MMCKVIMFLHHKIDDWEKLLERKCLCFFYDNDDVANESCNRPAKSGKQANLDSTVRHYFQDVVVIMRMNVTDILRQAKRNSFLQSEAIIYRAQHILLT